MMQNDNEPNTLAAHNVQVGDVVTFTKYGGGECRTISCISPYRADYCESLSEEPFWTVISRANPKSQNETQFGEWEIWNGKGEPPTGLVQVQTKYNTWFVAEKSHPKDSSLLSWNLIIAFRRVIKPVLGELVLEGSLRCIFGDQYAWCFSDKNGSTATYTHRLIIPTINGKLTPSKYTGLDGAVIIVEVSG